MLFQLQRYDKNSKYANISGFFSENLNYLHVYAKIMHFRYRPIETSRIHDCFNKEQRAMPYSIELGSIYQCASSIFFQ